MPLATLVSFDRTLTGVTVPGDSTCRYTETQMAGLVEAAYRRGFDAARAHGDQQMVEFRTEMVQLRDQVFERLERLEPALMAQLGETLPALAMDIARRLLAGFEPTAEIVARICEEALAGIFPERENLELVVSARDAALLAEMRPSWLGRFPGLRISADPALRPGDCLVRSRFGLTDARLERKLEALQHSLTPQ